MVLLSGEAAGFGALWNSSWIGSKLLTQLEKFLAFLFLRVAVVVRGMLQLLATLS